MPDLPAGPQRRQHLNVTRTLAPSVRRWASRFGDTAYAVDLPEAFGAVRRPWRGPLGADVAFQFAAEATAAPLGEAATRFSRLDADGFAFTAASCHGAGSWAQRAGTVYLHDGEQSPLARVQMLQEALFAPVYGQLLLQGGLLLHAATLWIDGRAYVVAGYSTAGKTTLSGRFAPNWLSDEHAFLARDGDQWHVLRHIDFRGNEGDFPWRAPVAGLLWLGPDRSQSRVAPLSPGDALQRLLPQALVAGPPTSALVLDAVAHLCQQLPVMELSHNLATSVADLAEMIAGASHAARG